MSFTWCRHSYPACKAHAPYCLLSPLWLYIIPHYFTNCTIFRGKKSYWTTKCVFWFSLQFLSRAFLIVWRIQRDITINVHTSSCIVAYSTVVFQWNFNFIDIFPEKNLNIKLYGNPPAGSRVVPWGWTDGRTDMMKLTVAFSKFAYAPKTDHFFHLSTPERYAMTAPSNYSNALYSETNKMKFFICVHSKLVLHMFRTTWSTNLRGLAASHC